MDNDSDNHHGQKEKVTEDINAIGYLEEAKQCRKKSIISGSMTEMPLKRTVSFPLTRMLLKLIVQVQSLKGERSRDLSEA